MRIQDYFGFMIIYNFLCRKIHEELAQTANSWQNIFTDIIKHQMLGEKLASASEPVILFITRKLVNILTLSISIILPMELWNMWKNKHRTVFLNPILPKSNVSETVLVVSCQM
jgi:hypothetical protein